MSVYQNTSRQPIVDSSGRILECDVCPCNDECDIIVGFWHEILSSGAGCTVTFHGFALTAGTVISWHWDFGGAGTSSFQEPTVVFPSPGPWTVTFTVVDSNGCVGVRTMRISCNINCCSAGTANGFRITFSDIPECFTDACEAAFVSPVDCPSPGYFAEFTCGETTWRWTVFPCGGGFLTNNCLAESGPWRSPIGVTLTRSGPTTTIQTWTIPSSVFNTCGGNCREVDHDSTIRNRAFTSPCVGTELPHIHVEGY